VKHPGKKIKNSEPNFLCQKTIFSVKKNNEHFLFALLIDVYREKARVNREQINKIGSYITSKKLKITV